MNPELAAIRDAMPHDRARAVALADAYVLAHPTEFDLLRTYSVPELVSAVDQLRAAGREEDQWRVEAYLLAKVPPQAIDGEWTISVPLSAFQ